MWSRRKTSLPTCTKGKALARCGNADLTWTRPVYNLNEMAHDATIKLIRQVIDSRVNLEEVSMASRPQAPSTHPLPADLCRSRRPIQLLQIQTAITLPWNRHHSGAQSRFIVSYRQCSLHLCQGHSRSVCAKLAMDRDRSCAIQELWLWIPVWSQHCQVDEWKRGGFLWISQHYAVQLEDDQPTHDAKS